MEEPDRLQLMGSQRLGRDLATKQEQQPTKNLRREGKKENFQGCKFLKTFSLLSQLHNIIPPEQQQQQKDFGFRKG